MKLTLKEEGPLTPEDAQQKVAELHKMVPFERQRAIDQLLKSHEILLATLGCAKFSFPTLVDATQFFVMVTHWGWGASMSQQPPDYPVEVWRHNYVPLSTPPRPAHVNNNKPVVLNPIPLVAATPEANHPTDCKSNHCGTDQYYCPCCKGTYQHFIHRNYCSARAMKSFRCPACGR